MEIRTDRLLIRDWQLEDAPAALDIQSRVEVVKWLGDGEPVLMKDIDEAVERIARWRGRDEPPLGFWAIEVTEPGDLHGRVVGSVLLVRLPNGDGEVEIGWHLHPDAWGHRYAAEAGRAILRRGFEGGLTEINAVTHLTNEPSMSVCRQIGMEHRGIVHTWYDDPSQLYVLDRDTWHESVNRAGPAG